MQVRVPLSSTFTSKSISSSVMPNVSAAKQRRLAQRSTSPQAAPGKEEVTTDLAPTTRAIHRPLVSPSMSAGSSVRLLVASLGNPAPYLETRHSAGHLVIKSIARLLSASPFVRDRSIAKGHVSTSFARPDWLLWQSPSLMNVSGPPLADALSAFSRMNTGDVSPVGLVLLHDELELSPGMVKERSKNTSHKGHNGLKSVAQSLRSSRSLDQIPMIKIGIGIGRPDGRGQGDVSDYVLKKMTRDEKQKLEDTAEKALALIDSFGEKIAKTKASL